MINDPDSFALKTFRVRMPGILARLIDDWRPSKREKLLHDLETLARDLANDVRVEPMPLLVPEIAAGPWSALPFLQAEVYFYNRILDIFEYERLGDDPFRFQKEQAKEACMTQMTELMNAGERTLEARFYGS